VSLWDALVVRQVRPGDSQGVTCRFDMLDFAMCWDAPASRKPCTSLGPDSLPEAWSTTL
jgi:hypothetical protein